MEVSLEWLQDFVDLPALDELCDKLQTAGIEVDAVSDPAQRAAGVVVGKIIACEKHPKADRLSVCKVTDGSSTHQVVCGASNVAAGQLVVLARVGVSVAGMNIEARQIRGQQSAGMICSQAELGLTDKSDGIWVLPNELEIGGDPFTQLDIGPVLSLGITPNRPDLLSHIGVAREIAAATGQRLKSTNWRLSERGASVSEQARVLVEDPDGCPRYIARVINNLQVGPSPQWLQRRLERVGQRPVNNIVDATNYVLFEMGQPLHAFDLDRLGKQSGLPTIIVRRAEPGEEITTLDDVKRQLHTDDLLICDPEHALAIAGVMGGADSEVTDATTAVLLESAYFTPSGIRRAAKRHGLHTESSHRFERGADPGITARAAKRCAQLLSEIGSGNVQKGEVETAQKMPPPAELTLRIATLPRLLGVEIPAEDVVQLLDPLDIRCTSRNQEALQFSLPSFRPDLLREVDLVEEVARRYGYDAIPERLPSTAGDYQFEPLPVPAADRGREPMLASGCSEVVTFGFGSPGAHSGKNGEPLRLRNPLGEELSAMRTSLLPGLLDVLGRNQRQGIKHVRIFEIGRTIHQYNGAAQRDEKDDLLPLEKLRLAWVLFGGRHMARWYGSGELMDFSDLAGIVESLVYAFDPQAALRLSPADLPGFNPAAAATISVGDTIIGTCGQLHPRRLSGLDLEGPSYAAEIELDVLAALQRRPVTHRSLPKFPGTRRDIAVICDRSLHAETIRGFLVEHAGGDLGDVVERVRLFDVYQGKPIPPDKISLAFAIEYRSAERTLTDEEVGAAFDAVIERLCQSFELEIR